ncbi:MAG: FAD-dependent pyridine nucleotide-disulfide oxidoreductase [Gemmatimonadetes bacterium]|nr:FAD-dependent pyridine nucleotide-disulfide oxidoreductase [Gemmatimonadota bacterium]
MSPALFVSFDLTQMSNASGPMIIPLCVIGCGPTGIAALFEAKRQGIQAIGIEARPSALGTFVEHPEGLVYLSHPSHFEIAGVPLDCHHPKECTREDVLHYYARIINWGRLDIRSSTRCVGIAPQEDGVLLTLSGSDGPAIIRAQQVLITSWYARRPVRQDRKKGAVPRVITSFRNPVELLGERVVVIGGGLSGCELATSLMMSGASIVLAMRGLPKPFHSTIQFAKLLRNTRSVIEADLSALRICDGYVEAERNGRHVALECSVVVAASGAAIDQETCDLLEEAQILGASAVTALANAPTFEDGVRIQPAMAPGERLAWVAANRPDLWEYLFDGVNGVRFAGAVLHGGGPHAGVLVSIASARLAVQAIAGKPAPAWARPLASALTDIRKILAAVGSASDIDLLRAIRPVRVASWSRTWRPPHVGHSNGAHNDLGHLGPRSLSALEARVLSLVNDDRTVQDIVECEAQTGNREEDVHEALRGLFHHHVLTWLPPRHALAPGPQ